MSDLLQQGDLKPVAIIAEKVVGEKPAKSTTWRWIHHGVSGEKLEAVNVMNAWRTTEAAFRDFIDRQTAVALAPPEPAAPPATDDDLRASGLL